MTDPTSVATCRFARLTVRMPYPLWLEAEDKPWTCLREEPARPLDDASVCHECPHWMPHRVHVEELVQG
jgi:hypothetical protein